MRNRTRSREYALQILYQADMRNKDMGKVDREELIPGFWVGKVCADDIKEFAGTLVNGTIDNIEAIDALISKHADNWDIIRMAVIDRNILRLGAYELLHTRDVPPKVCMNEAIELAKRFGDIDSGKFINGILDALHRDNENPKRQLKSKPRLKTKKGSN